MACQIVSVALLLTLVACTSPSPTTTPAASAGATARVAALTVRGSGQLECSNSYGCEAAFVLKPAPWTPPDLWGHEPDADWHKFHLAVAGDGSFRWDVAGSPAGLPASIAAGEYRLGAVANLISDVNSPGYSQMPIMGTLTSCLADLTVTSSTAAVEIAVTLDGTTCAIDITTR
jgi:hypothetical protein